MRGILEEHACYRLYDFEAVAAVCKEDHRTLHLWIDKEKGLEGTIVTTMEYQFAMNRILFGIYALCP